MRLQDQVYEVYRNNINENMEENRKGALAMKEALEKSPLNHNGVLEKTLQIPKVIDEQTVEQFQAITEMAIRVFDKVIGEYRKNPEYRRLFPFSKKLEELILLPPAYDGNLAICRLDLFYDKDSGDFRFCEINTDGTAAMYRDLEMRKALIFNPAHTAAEEALSWNLLSCSTPGYRHLCLCTILMKKRRRIHTSLWRISLKTQRSRNSRNLSRALRKPKYRVKSVISEPLSTRTALCIRQKERELTPFTGEL